MAEHLLSNIYQVGGGDISHPLDGASYVVVDGLGQNHVLIDCGSPLGYGELTRQLDYLDIEIGKIAVIYATHGHFDHVAAATHMVDKPLYLHPNDINGILTGDPNKTATFLYDDQSFPEIKNIEPIPEAYEATIGKTRLSVLHTPGHSPGSVCYKLETDEGVVLLAGDTLWGCYEDRLDSNLEQWEQSLYLLSQDTFDYVSFGHGVSKLIPDAMSHIDLARSRFNVNMQPSHNNLVFNPWVEPSKMPK